MINDVGDGDAIFIGLSRPEKSLVVILDGGRRKSSVSVMANLHDFLRKYKKTSPDLVIGSHYDNDHIEGLLPVIRYYGAGIKQLWMFDTNNMMRLAGDYKAHLAKTRENMFPSEYDTAIGGSYTAGEVVYAEELIKSLAKEKEILEYARHMGIPVQEPVAGECIFPGWEEVRVIGPTPAYYKTLFPEHLPLETLLKDPVEDAAEDALSLEPCAAFNRSLSPVTRVNLNSAIISIQIEDRQFLFPADAGIQSFTHIPDYENKLKNIFWLKMPHHGSSNNINTDLIDLFSPRQVAISGDKYISDALITCMRSKGIEVRTTRDEKGPLVYEF